MSVLDELRESITALFLNGVADTGTVRAVFDAFEALHPGLVDYSYQCPSCGEMQHGLPCGIEMLPNVCPACAKEAP